MRKWLTILAAPALVLGVIVTIQQVAPSDRQINKSGASEQTQLCPSEEELEEILVNQSRSVKRMFKGSVTHCHLPWAYGVAPDIVLSDGVRTSTSFLLSHKDWGWKMVSSGQDMGGSSYCSTVPPAIRDAMSCYVG